VQRNAASSAAPHSPISHVGFTSLGKLSPQIPETHKLLRGQYLSDRKLALKSQPCQFALRRSELAETCLEVGVRDRVRVDCHIESTVRFAQPVLGSHHRRTAFPIHLPYLLNLFNGQAELRKKIRTAVRVIILMAITWWRTLLTERQTRQKE
jgi:hypothetical protein